MSRLPIPHFIQEIKAKLGFDRTMTAPGEDIVDAVNKQSQQKANKPITVTVTVGTDGASMTAADQAKFTPDMRMCSYSVLSGAKDSLTTDLTITPGQTAGTASVTGSAAEQVVFSVSFIQTATA